jgi:hypothetical protein
MGVWEDCQVPVFAQFLTLHSPGVNLPPRVFARCVIECYGSELCPERCGACCPLRKSKRADPTENLQPPRIMLGMGPKLIGILTSIMKDCGPLLGGTSPAPSGRGGVGICRCQTSDQNMSKCLSKHNFFTSHQK